jgi:peptide/nickel transport system substrate-binding protein
MFHVSHWKRATIALNSLCRLLRWRVPALADAKNITAVIYLCVVDPGPATVNITGDQGYMVYDTLLATDFQFQDPAADGGVEQADLHLHDARRIAIGQI